VAVVVEELTTVETSIGFDVNDRVLHTDSFQKRFVVQDADDDTFADFTGFGTVVFELVDSAGVQVILGTTTPATGDATGTFIGNFTIAQMTSLLAAGVNERELAYRLFVSDGALVAKTLFCGAFRVQRCAAAA